MFPYDLMCIMNDVVCDCGTYCVNCIRVRNVSSGLQFRASNFLFVVSELSQEA